MFFFRKILDDLASDAPVKMENYDDNGSSNASSPGGDEQQHQQAQQQAQQQYQSIQLNGVIAPPSTVGSTVVQLNDGQVLKLSMCQLIVILFKIFSFHCILFSIISFQSFVSGIYNQRSTASWFRKCNISITSANG